MVAHASIGHDAENVLPRLPGGAEPRLFALSRAEVELSFRRGVLISKAAV